jgi:hypothetical protein
MFEIKINSAPQWYECEANWSWQPPPLGDCDLWYVARGHGEMSLREELFVLEPGRCFVVPPASSPRARQDAARRLRVFAVHFSWLDDERLLDDERAQVLEARPPLSWMVRDREGFERLALTAESCWRRALEQKPAESEVESEVEKKRALGAVQMMLWQGVFESRAPREEPGDELLRELAALLRREPWRRMSLDEMAARVHLSAHSSRVASVY